VGAAIGQFGGVVERRSHRDEPFAMDAGFEVADDLADVVCDAEVHAGQADRLSFL
jgi:hypothetical protein